jgi:SP family sugar:H+ symporter-like MFS transporter
MIAFFSAPIANNIHFKYGFVFAGANFLNMIVAMFFVYETVDLTLEAIDTMYGDESVNAWTSIKWVPAGYSSRDEIRASGAAQTENDLEKSTSNGNGDKWKSDADPITGEEKDSNKNATQTRVDSSSGESV